jgi:cation diffusion facilitator family transporter
MAKFPEPLKLPSEIPVARINRNAKLVKSSIWGICIRLSVIAFELVGVVLFGSSALLMDALSSLFDVASSIFLIICIKLAARPPDKEHPFGHGRYEPLGGLQLGLLLILLGGGLIVQQVGNIFNDIDKEPLNPYAWIFPFLAVVLLEVCYQVVVRAAKKQNSPALAVDALHYRIDALTSLFAMVALVFAAYLPNWSLLIDHIGAIAIAIVMMVIGIIASRNNLNQLLDRIPDKKYFDGVKKAAKSVAGVKETEKIRIQLCGPDAHVDIDVEVDPKLSVDKAHEISQEVRLEIQKAWPAVQDVTVHIEPYYPGDH